MDDLELLQDEQEIYDNEEDIRRLKKQVRTRKVVAGVFFVLFLLSSWKSETRGDGN